MSVELIPHDDPYADIVFADPKPKSVNVMIGDDPYRLKEATEGAYLDYESARGRGATLEDGKLSMGDTASAEAVLLAGCLFKLSQGGKTEAQVPLVYVRGLPSRVAQPLIQRLKIISGISDLETADQLRKRIAADSKKLEKLEAGKAGDTGPKGSPPASQGTSASLQTKEEASGIFSGGLVTKEP